MNEHSETFPDAIEEKTALEQNFADVTPVSHERKQSDPMHEAVSTANAICKAEEELRVMTEAVCAAITEAGFPKISKAILLGALSASMLSAPEAARAGEEAVTIPKEHVLKFEKNTGLKLEELAQKYGIRVDHSMTSPGATKWVIHIAQAHGQMVEGDIPAPLAVAKSQIKTYNLLNEMRARGVHTSFNEGHTNNPDDVLTLIQKACTEKRNNTPSDEGRQEKLFALNGFFNTAVRSYLQTPTSYGMNAENNEVLTKLGGATMLGCEGKMQVLPAEDYEVNQSLRSLDVFGDSEEVMVPYKKALAEAITLGYTKTGVFNFNDKNALLEYEKAVTDFLAYNFSSDTFDTDPMATLLARLKDDRVRAVFEDFNQRFEIAKNKALKFDREIVALKQIGAHTESSPAVTAIPLVYGAIHNFVSSLPAYNKEHPIKLNYIRLNTLPDRNLVKAFREGGAPQ